MPNDPVLILAAGMPRSASTWLYNVARLLLSEAIGNDFSCGWVGDLKNIPVKKYMLIKLHDYDKSLVEQSKYIMYSYRDVRDAMASNLRKFNQVPCMKEADYMINQYEKWTMVSNFIMRYESMITDQSNIIKKLGKDLEIEVPHPEDIIQKIDGLSYENEGNKNVNYHSINLYHPGHITDGGYGTWHGLLDPELVREIEKKYKSWFKKCGYPI